MAVKYPLVLGSDGLPQQLQSSDTLPSSGTSTIAGATDANITGALNNQLLTYNSSNSKWENKTLTALAGGIVLGTSPNQLTVSSSGVVTLSGTAGMPSRLGYQDITPSYYGGDSTNGASFTQVGTYPIFRHEFPGSGPLKQRPVEFHAPHDIYTGAQTVYYHLHWIHTTASPTGNAYFQISYQTGLRDGSLSAVYTTTMTITPTAGNANAQNVFEIALPNITTLLPDQLVFVVLMRDPAHANDTFTGSIWVGTSDLHVLQDGALTVNKDADGSGNWPKVSTLLGVNSKSPNRLVSVVSSATPTPNADTTDCYELTAQAATAGFVKPTGNPTSGQPLLISIKDNGTSQAITWDSGYRTSQSFPLPSNTVVGQWLRVGFIYNAVDLKWDCVAVNYS